jgi:hypothetical protein
VRPCLHEDRHTFEQQHGTMVCSPACGMQKLISDTLDVCSLDLHGLRCLAVRLGAYTNKGMPMEISLTAAQTTRTLAPGQSEVSSCACAAAELESVGN